jgi:hypothetical protein
MNFPFLGVNKNLQTFYITACLLSSHESEVWYNRGMKKPYPQDFRLNITPVGDHLEIHIAPLDITVSTAPGKTSHSDALDVAQAAIEQHVMRDLELYPTARQAVVQ